jgi:hypothetical protein
VPELVLLIVDGLQLPFIPLSDMVGKAGTELPAQIVSDEPILNTGIITGFTVTLNVVDTAHWPTPGANVYVPELLGSTIAGLHVPLTPFDDVFGKVGTAPPEHIFNDVPNANVGVNTGFTVTVNVAVAAH